MPPPPKWLRKIKVKKFREITEQHREKGRFKPTVPRMVPNTPVVSPRPSSDSADVRLKEASAAAIAAATAISKKKSGNYDKKGMRVKPYKNPDHPNRKSNEQRRKEMNEYVQQQDPAELRGTSSGAMSLLDKPNKEPMRKYKDLKQIAELSTELLHRYKEKAAADASKADKEGNFERGNKRFSGVVKATNKQFANFKKKGFKEEAEQIDEISAMAHKEYQAKARSDVKSLAKHIGGEYGDIAKNIMQRRMKGLSTSTALQARDRLAKMNKEETKMNEAKDEREYDYEGDMAKTQLKTIIRNAQKIHDMIEDDENMPEWVQSKITLAKDYIVVAANYLESEMSEQANQGATKEKETKFHTKLDKLVHNTFGKSPKEMKKEEVEQLDEKNKPTNPELWSRAKALARSKFDVYPSAYANGWAAKWYKSKGGGWRSVSEETEKAPFEPTKTKEKVVAGKYGKGYSTARHLARQAMQKQVEKMKKKPIKEESKKAKLVKDVMKKKTSEDAFQKDPEMSNTITKNV